jgi:hypothetical protein
MVGGGTELIGGVALDEPEGSVGTGVTSVVGLDDPETVGVEGEYASDAG